MNRKERRAQAREDAKADAAFRSETGYTGKIEDGGVMPTEIRDLIIEHMKIWGVGPCDDPDCPIVFGPDVKSVDDVKW